MSFTYADLFSGIGGFHAAMTAVGGECWFASEIDGLAREVYTRNWGLEPKGNIVPLTDPDLLVPKTDVLAAGFPCQPFSKSGYQRGMNETRGTLFFNICRVLKVHKPKVILLENVRNLAGPRQADTWDTIVDSLRDLGYRVSGKPAVFSPHLLPPERGGRPQVRERVFITGTYVGRDRAMAETQFDPVVSLSPVDGWNPKAWDLAADLPLDGDVTGYRLTAAERRWLDCWNDWLVSVDEPKLPGFPIWADEFRYPAEVPDETPAWKADFLRKNAELYQRNREAIDAWKARWNDLADMPASRRKLEWQAQDTQRDLYKCVLHFRPSGIRAKKPTYLPALVAITQTSVVPVERGEDGHRSRRITPREAARLQGLPEWFDFGSQPESATYRQLGNGVSVGAAYHVFREHVLHERERDDIPERIVRLVEDAPLSPDDRLETSPLAQPLESGMLGAKPTRLGLSERTSV